jgi:hypothetical protein
MTGTHADAGDSVKGDRAPDDTQGTSLTLTEQQMAEPCNVDVTP